MGASLGMVSAALADAGTDAAGISAALQNVPAAAVRQPARALHLPRWYCEARRSSVASPVFTSTQTRARMRFVLERLSSALPILSYIVSDGDNAGNTMMIV